MKSSSFLVYLKLLNALFVTKIMKQLSISFVIALLEKRYGMTLYDLTPQTAFFGFTEKDLNNTILQNHLLLVFKIYLYKSRSCRFVCLKPLLLEMKKSNCWEKKIGEANANKHKSYLLKWNEIDNQLAAYN